MYCEHHRTADACEDCAYARAVAAGRPMEGLFRAATLEAPSDAPREADRPAEVDPLPEALPPR